MNVSDPVSMPKREGRPMRVCNGAQRVASTSAEIETRASINSG